MGECAAGSFGRTQPRGLAELILEWHAQCFLRPGPAPAGAAGTGHPWNPAGRPARGKERQLCFQTEIKRKKERKEKFTPKTRGQGGQEEVQCLFWVKAKGCQRSSWRKMDSEGGSLSTTDRALQLLSFS